MSYYSTSSDRTKVRQLRQELAAAQREISVLAARNAELERRYLADREQPLVQLDLERNTVTVSKGENTRALRGKWAELFALLLLRSGEPGGRLLSASELHSLMHWRDKMEQSVGKMVSRLMKKLEDDGLDGVIEFDGQKTTGWRLGIDVSVQSAIKNTEIESILETRGWRRSSVQSMLELSAFADWVKSAVSALEDLQAGEVGEAQEKAQKLIQDERDPILNRVARMIAIRTIQRAGTALDKYEIDIGDYGEVRSWGIGPIARAFHARAVALKKHWSEFGSYENEIGGMRGLIEEAEDAGDIGAIGVLHGTLAVLLRRTGRYEQAVEALRRAIPLLIANGDVLNLQGALFNLGHAIERLARKEGRYDYQLALSMLALDASLRENFNLGSDSAQCEILMALILSESDPHSSDADRLLGKAKELIGKNHSEFDQACWHRAQAKLAYKRAETSDKPMAAETRGFIIAELRRAITWFEKAGRRHDGEDTKQKLATFEAREQAW